MTFQINPDSEYAKGIKTLVKSNGGYCPCQTPKSKDTKCMCKDFREQMMRGESGFCICGLYNAVDDSDVEDDKEFSGLLSED